MQDADVVIGFACFGGNCRPGGEGGIVQPVQLRGNQLLPLLLLRRMAVPQLQDLTYQGMPWKLFIVSWGFSGVF